MCTSYTPCTLRVSGILYVAYKSKLSKPSSIVQKASRLTAFCRLMGAYEFNATTNQHSKTISCVVASVRMARTPAQQYKDSEIMWAEEFFLTLV
jgi:hypothetical protein